MRLNIPHNWTFKNPEIAQGFDSHVRQQLPWYDMATSLVAQIARHHIPEKGIVYDVGASTGNIGRAIEQTLTERKARLYAVDNSSEMMSRYIGPGELIVGDITRIGFKRFDVCVCFLVLMFLPPKDQELLMNMMLMQAKAGSAIIIVDKFESKSGQVQSMLNKVTISGKLSGGATADEVIEKEFSLIGVQRPLSRNFVNKYLANAHPFFRYGEFAGYVIIKS